MVKEYRKSSLRNLVMRITLEIEWDSVDRSGSVHVFQLANLTGGGDSGDDRTLWIVIPGLCTGYLFSQYTHLVFTRYLYW
jgi:hypothetical protein